MIFQWILDLGPWSWVGLGAGLLTLEIVVPGVYLLWIGIAAILTGTVSLQLWEAAFWTWQVQVLLFLALSIASALLGRRYFAGSGPEETDQPLLNQRGRQLVGRTATLEEDIREGRGRIRLGDTMWRVTGPDLPAGTRVRVTEADGGDLRIEAL